MKRFLTFLIAFVIGLSLCACGGKNKRDTNRDEYLSPAETPAESNIMPIEPEESIPEEVYYSVGDAVSTDIFEFTLEKASFAIALNNSLNDHILLPKVYNKATDNKNPYVASVGHTLVAITYTVNNINRARTDFHRGGLFVQVRYNDEDYETYLKDKAYYLHQARSYVDVDGKTKTDEANKWYYSASNNLVLGAGEKETRRAYAELNVEADSLSDEFILTVNVPNSSGERIEFMFRVNA